MKISREDPRFEFYVFCFLNHQFLYKVFIRLLKDDHPHLKSLILTEFDRIKGNDWQCRSVSFSVQKENCAASLKVV